MAEKQPLKWSSCFLYNLPKIQKSTLYIKHLARDVTLFKHHRQNPELNHKYHNSLLHFLFGTINEKKQ